MLVLLGPLSKAASSQTPSCHSCVTHSCVGSKLTFHLFTVMLYRPRTAPTPQAGMFALCAEKKKPLNTSKSTCCTFSQVVGQKRNRTGSCHHRFQVKHLLISRSVLIFFFFFGKNFLFCKRSGSVDTYKSLRVGNHVPGKQISGLS